MLLLSMDLDEILALSDRITVMYGGKVVGTMDSEKAERGKLGLLMAGDTREYHVQIQLPLDFGQINDQNSSSLR